MQLQYSCCDICGCQYSLPQLGKAFLCLETFTLLTAAALILQQTHIWLSL
jgi:hypothetical protein